MANNAGSQSAGYYNNVQPMNYDPQYAQQHDPYPQNPMNNQQQQQQQQQPMNMSGGPMYQNNQNGPPQYTQEQTKYNDGTIGDQSFDQAFKLTGPKWNDLWAGILFLVVVAGFVAVSGISIQGYAHTKGFNGGSIYGSGNTFGLTTNTIILFVFCLASAFVLSFAYVALARLFPKTFIWITGILNIVFGLVTAIYMLSRRYYSGGIVFLIFSLFTIFCFITWIPRIPFSALMLTTSVDVSKKYGRVYLVSLIGGLLATAFGAWFSVTLVAVYVKYEPGNNPACTQGAGNCSSAKVIGLVVFITFAGYWITEWLKNTIHTIISGVYGSWYFYPNNSPKGVTRGATKRALTYSFGSISFGSLMVAIINMLRQACSVVQRTAAQEGNILMSVLACCLGCLIGILDWAVQFLNRYAFSYIALYGKAYIPAAKATWQMIKSRGIDALINECLLGPVFTMGATFVAYACALLAYLYLIFTRPEYNSQGQFTPVVVAFAFLIGLQICQIFVTPLSSGIDTLFVAMAYQPEVLYNEHSTLYNEIKRVYPQIENAVQDRA